MCNMETKVCSKCGEEESFTEHSYEDKLEMIGNEIVMLYTKMVEEKGKGFGNNEMKWLLDDILVGTINSSDINSDRGWTGHFTKMGDMDKHLRDKDGGMGSL